ncbi:MAG TPA: pyridoxal-dependent decarboxylase [Gemmatimonadaceae bacterium]|nr:pyridoxal-dependent decarboxylase [Gemmatimonadaceae bacterium]
MSDDPDRRSPADLSSLFLGPKAENADVFERLLLEAFRDHVFWRRNFHPEDGFTIREQDKFTPGYQASIATLSQELFGLLAELKDGVPFFSPRYVGHMASDPTMASLIGYIATMLYNPNNVAAEGSPVTTRLELQVAAQLARMFGYRADRQWGHLCSGGTVANIEALWVARNLKYLPVALRWGAEELGIASLHVVRPNGERARLDDLGVWELLNIAPDAALDAYDAFGRATGDPQVAAAAVARHGISGLGYQAFGLRLAERFGDALPPGVVLVPSTAHYSFAKACRVLGMGESHLLRVPVDTHFRVDTDALEEILHASAAQHRPVIAAVAVMGTTEEGAVDRLDLIDSARVRAGRRHGLAFYLHADAAWGGYASAVVRATDGEKLSFEAVSQGQPAGALWPSESVYHAFAALDRADSVTVDPHKLGAVPYPAGAISFRDRRVRGMVSVDAPYLFHEGDSDTAYIGRFILEGSKPGAAAASVWMAHKVLPLDATGYGRLIGESARGALALHAALGSCDLAPFRLVLLPRPDVNIVCFAIGHPEFEGLEESNELVDRVYRAMSIGGGRPLRALDYLVTKTVLLPREYGHAADPVVEGLGFTHDDYLRAGGVAVVRCTVMDPFLAARRGNTDHIAGFIATLERVLNAELAGMRAPASTP